MPAQEAMRQYIETLTNLDPDWQAGASSRGPKQKQGGAGGPVFSTMRDFDAEQQQVWVGIDRWMPLNGSAPTNLRHPCCVPCQYAQRRMWCLPAQLMLLPTN